MTRPTGMAQLPWPFMNRSVRLMSVRVMSTYRPSRSIVGRSATRPTAYET